MAGRKLGSLLTHFQDLEDPRLERTRLHSLLDIVAITLCAVISGADSWVEVAEYGVAKFSWLQRFLKLPHGIPSHDTFGRVFAALRPEEFQRCFANWMDEVVEQLGLKHVAIDGKTLRGSHHRAKGQAALHLISAWAVENHLTLGQQAVDPQSNEITAIPSLLELLDLQGALVSIDAIGCQKEIAEQIVEQGGDYLLSVKENQPKLYEEIEQLDTVALENEYAGVSQSCVEEPSHGRHELRACWVLTDLKTINERGRWKNLRSVLVVLRDRTEQGKNSCEKQFYISSRKGSAQKFLEAIRGHWGIENSLHWVLDVTFDEDRSRVRKDHGPENLALVRRWGVSMLKAEKSKKSIRSKRMRAGWDNRFMEKVLMDFEQI